MSSVKNLPDISGLSLPQLNELSEAITARKSELQAEKRKELLAKFKELATNEGIHLKELLGDLAGGKKSGARKRGKPSGDPASLKFYNPETGEGWPGKGRPPKWLSTPEGKLDKKLAAKYQNPNYRDAAA